MPRRLKSRLQEGSALLYALLLTLILAIVTVTVVAVAKAGAQVQASRTTTALLKMRGGDALETSRTLLETDALSALRSEAQYQADNPSRFPEGPDLTRLMAALSGVQATLCGQGIKLTVAGQSNCLGNSALSSEQIGMKKSPSGYAHISFPWTLEIRQSSGRAALTVTRSGQFNIGLGQRGPLGYAMRVASNTDFDGRPVYFDASSSTDGDVMINESPRVKGTPQFSGDLESASCKVGSGAGTCVQGLPALIIPQGSVDSLALRPSPNRPCYPDACPVLGGTLDLENDPLPTLRLEATGEALRLRSLDRLTLAVEGGVYQRITACVASTCEEYRASQGGPLEKLSNGRWGGPVNWDGNIYVSGEIKALLGTGDAPAVASWAQISVLATQGIRITGSLFLTNPPCQGYLEGSDTGLRVSNCSNLSANNKLVIASSGGDVLIGNGATMASQAGPDLSVAAALLAPQGRVGQEAPASGGAGTFNLLGAVISRTMPVWGARNVRFQYDPRWEGATLPIANETPVGRASVGMNLDSP